MGGNVLVVELVVPVLGYFSVLDQGHVVITTLEDATMRAQEDHVERALYAPWGHMLELEFTWNCSELLSENPKPWKF
jgi:hypothetical protein